MNLDFPRIITLLRKEKGLSQKKVATDLNISQALLSHYEKGVRECGLDFIVKISKYYNVSCDYLLGLSENKNGNKIDVDNIPDASSLKDNVFKGSVLSTLNKKLIINSINIIFDLLQKYNNKKLINEISSFMMINIYKIFRLIYSSNPKNPQELFKVQNNFFEAYCTATLLLNELKIKQMSQNENNINNQDLTPDAILELYPSYASSINNIIKSSENYILSTIQV